jgi:hypothetical protein
MREAKSFAIKQHTHLLKLAEILGIDAWQEFQNSVGYSEILRRYRGSKQAQPPRIQGSGSLGFTFPKPGISAHWRSFRVAQFPGGP